MTQRPLAQKRTQAVKLHETGAEVQQKASLKEKIT